MNIKMLESVEDANTFDALEDGATDNLDIAKHFNLKTRPFRESSPYERHPDVEDKEVHAIARVDSLRKGKTYDLPEQQAKALIERGLAREVTGDDE